MVDWKHQLGGDGLVHIVSVPQSHSKGGWPGVLLISCTAHLICSHQLLTFCNKMLISSLATQGMKFTCLPPQRSGFSLERTRINIESDSQSCNSPVTVGTQTKSETTLDYFARLYNIFAFSSLLSSVKKSRSYQCHRVEHICKPFVEQL